jgi:biopolymer transport protein ExbD
MNLSRKQRRELRTSRLLARETELNIVSLIDVFAVLVFFLLANSSILAARLNVLSLNLPEEQASLPPPKEEPLALTVTVLQDRLLVQTFGGAPRTIANTADGYDIGTLGATLAEIKREHPEEQDVVLALEPDIPYDYLIQVMDAARVTPDAARAQGLPEQMFPNVALSDARPSSAGAKR